jgi:citrate synthase
MTSDKPPITRGLEGVFVNETEISDVDGSEGTLEYRGYHIRDLALTAQFEEVIYLLWYGKLPTKTEYETFTKELHQYRAIPLR